MAILHIKNFGGEFPRVPARQLAAEAAQVNENLLATSSDFRPVLKSSVVTAAANNAVTLYRTQLDANGNPLSDLTQGWITSAGDYNHVRGQINGTNTERTYLSDNTGATPARVVSNNGTNFQLGIPAPGSNSGRADTWSKPEVILLKANQFTYAQANAWLKSTLVPAVHDLVINNLSEDQITSRWVCPTGSLFPSPTAPTSVAGATVPLDMLWQKYPKMVDSPTKLGSQRGVVEPWNMMIRVNSMYTVLDGKNLPVDGFANPQLGATPSRTDGSFGALDSSELTSGNPIWVGLHAFPLWGVLNKNALKTALQAIPSPDGYQDFLWASDAKAQAMCDKLYDLISPSTSAVLSKRKELDNAIHSFGVAAIKSIQHSGDKPVSTVTDYDAKLAGWKKIHADAVTAMLDAQTLASKISTSIEKMYVDAKTNLMDAISTLFGGTRLEKTEDFDDGLVAVTAPVTDTRFYVTTFVSASGEESAPSAVSMRVDVESNDLVVVRPPKIIPSDRNITKWRIYRTNTGTQAAAFQFVAERALGASTVLAPQSTPGIGSANANFVGFETTHKWRDFVANYMILSNRGILTSSVEDYINTSKYIELLRIGDAATQRDERAGKTYSITKRWNGDAWVMGKVPDVSPYVGQQAFIDGKYGSSLGEVCPTITWSTPPDNIRGFVNMPNGVLAGYFGNFVTFCEPYMPYAWPVEYQIPTEYPIVGLCAFGQSLIVGTSGNPYIISGADSASMSAQKMDSPQSCVSRRSMVAAMGGVLYASPDGYCFANQGGVEVITTGMFSNEDWAKLTPSSIFALVHDSVLYFWYSGNGGGCYGLDFTSRKLTRHDIKATAVFDDVVTDYSYATYMGKVVKLLSPSGGRATGTWKSGKASLTQQAALAWIKVMGDFEAGPVTVNWYGDGILRRTATFSSIEPQRLPPGRYLEHEVEVISPSRVTSVLLAGSTDELKAIQ